MRLRSRTVFIVLLLAVWVLSLGTPALASEGFGLDTNIPSLGKPLFDEAGNMDASSNAAVQEVLGRYRKIGSFVFGFCTVTALLFFIFNITKLSMSAGNDMARNRALKGLLYSGLALSLFGGSSIIFSIAVNLF